MKMFHLTHPDQVGELPADFVAWAFQFERIENEARVELEKKAMQKRG